jgi:S1-C subfamily serine protease
MKLQNLVIAAALVGGFVYYTSGRFSPLRSFKKDGPVWSESKVLSAGLSADENNNIEIYKAASGSVVYITSTVYQQTFFFERELHELGSGFIINADGEILTNNHVVSGSSALEVTLPDQSRYKARILLRDQANDLALIKIEPKSKLKALTLGNSEGLQVGQKVLAIGNPFGLSGTLTTGVVSSLGRTIQGENQQLEGMIQTDAAINSGNSGGPLLDSAGNVIGINTAIYGPNGGSVGIGFAMPISRAKAMLDDFTSGRKPASTRVGVSTYYFTGDWAEALKLPRSGGLLISRVDRGSPAGDAGLRGAKQTVQVGNYLIDIGGDLITAVDGKAVDQQDAITRAISKKHAGDSLDLTILRDGRSMNVKVTLSAQSEVL